MKHNPYGSSCGTSIVVAPNQVRATTGKLGTAGARLSEALDGRALKPPRSKEEKEAMKRHPAGKALIESEALDHPAGCPCYCNIVKSREREMNEMADDMELMAMMLRERVHAKVQQNIADEANMKEYTRRERAEHLRLIGDSDA